MSAIVGQTIAVMMIVYGVFRLFSGGGFGGLWLAFLGWFLKDAAMTSYAGVEAALVLSKVRVGDVMSHDCPTVDGNMNLRSFAEDYLRRTGHRCFVVLEKGNYFGLLTINELKQVRPERWPFTTLAQIAIPFEKVRTVSPDTPVSEAVQLMADADLNQLPVMSNGRLLGVISRSDVLQFLQTQAELKAA